MYLKFFLILTIGLLYVFEFLKGNDENIKLLNPDFASSSNK